MEQKVLVEAIIIQNNVEIFRNDFIENIDIRNNFNKMLDIIQTFFIMEKGIVPKFTVDDYDEGTCLALLQETKTGSHISIQIKELLYNKTL